MWSSCKFWCSLYSRFWIICFFNYLNTVHINPWIDLFQWTIGAIVSVHWRLSLCRPLWRSCCLFVSLFLMYMYINLIMFWVVYSVLSLSSDFNYYRWYVTFYFPSKSKFLTLTFDMDQNLFCGIFLLVLRCHGHDDWSLLQTYHSSCLQMFNMRIFYQPYIRFHD